MALAAWLLTCHNLSVSAAQVGLEKSQAIALTAVRVIVSEIWTARFFVEIPALSIGWLVGILVAPPRAKDHAVVSDHPCAKGLYPTGSTYSFRGDPVATGGGVQYFLAVNF